MSEYSRSKMCLIDKLHAMDIDCEESKKLGDLLNALGEKLDAGIKSAGTSAVREFHDARDMLRKVGYISRTR